MALAPGARDTRGVDFDVVVIGSGYGGSVMAARLAPLARVLLVERGRRWSAGEFPTTIPGLVRSLRTDRNPLGLWMLRLGRGTGNAVGNGLGGGSLLNYGITSKPDPHVFDEWPVSAAEMDPYYERAHEVLRPSANPAAAGLHDAAFLDRVAPGLRVDLVNTIDWARCTQCGNCVPGCNQGAKRSLDKTYLPMALERGAELRLETEVDRIRPVEGGGWDVFLRQAAGGRGLERVRARAVVVSAGTFGTLDLFYRHRDVLPLSAAFGRGMGMNGDAAAFLYNTEVLQSGSHGAPITTTVRYRFEDETGRRRTLTVMAGRIPRSMARVSGALMASIGGLHRRIGPPPPSGRWERARRALHDLARIDERGALERTFMFKLDGQDTARGVASFDRHGRASIDWPDYSRDPVLRFADDRLVEWARKVGGTVIHDPGRWPGLCNFGVHPLGGCRMARSVADGVVDDRCRVFRPDGSLYPGLRIVDASVLPTSLGVPPSFTISAVAERAAEALAAELASR